MKVFVCGNCRQLLYFENSVCLGCGAPQGFLPDRLALAATAPGADGGVTAAGGAWRACGNAGVAGCNWLIPAEEDAAFCAACRLNRTIPDIDLPENLERWRRIETAKRRLIYALTRFGLPIEGRGSGEATGLAFDFLADTEAGRVMTGHEDGLITINIAEADDAERERRRAALGEPYRTLIGHMRHEIGHFYWDRLVRDGGRIEAARAVFGDERADYQAAVARHYAEGAPGDWSARFVSEYATMHPWEDFAETWTHYLHIVDTLDTAAAFGVAVDPVASSDPEHNARVLFDPYRAPGIGPLIDAWLPLTYAVNSLNRSMGQPDLYPFVLSAPAILKLGFIHDLIAAGAGRRA
jgi:hypothetical protein